MSLFRPPPVQTATHKETNKAMCNYEDKFSHLLIFKSGAKIKKKKEKKISFSKK